MELFLAANSGAAGRCMVVHSSCGNTAPFYLSRLRGSKAQQIADLLAKADICPAANDTCFYTLDCLKNVDKANFVYGNCTANYDAVVHNSLYQISDVLAGENDEFGQEEQVIISALRAYLEHCRKLQRFAGNL